jgi:hypothetical protein
VLLAAFVASTPSASAVLIPEEEHWKYNAHWIWKSSLRKSVGIIDTQIIIENETATRLEGYIADANGTRLSFYDDAQVVMVKYGSEWQIADKTDQGFFTVEIPEKYRDLDIIGLYIGSNSYNVDAGPPQPLVLTNPVRMDYRTDSTLVFEPETQVAAVEDRFSAWKKPSGDSLIDRILQQFSSSV